jgi:hypothetical protein
MDDIHYCLIRNGVVYANGEMLFEFSSNDLTQMTEAMYLQFELAYPKFYKMDMLCRLGMIAAHILFMRKPLVQEDPYKTAIVLGNRESSGDTDARFQQSMVQASSPSLFVYTLPNIIIGELCIRYQIKGEQVFFVEKSFDAAFMSNYINVLFENSLASSCLSGWIDVMNGIHDVFLCFLKPTHFQLEERNLSNLLTELYQAHGSININAKVTDN